jgi:hypothetical protein
MTDTDRLHEEYVQERDRIIKSVHSSNLTDYLDAIRPAWQTYEHRRLRLTEAPAARRTA